MFPLIKGLLNDTATELGPAPLIFSQTALPIWIIHQLHQDWLQSRPENVTFSGGKKPKQSEPNQLYSTHEKYPRRHLLTHRLR
jgi:hypothetical protein